MSPTIDEIEKFEKVIPRALFVTNNMSRSLHFSLSYYECQAKLDCMIEEYGVTTTNYGYESDAFQQRNAKKSPISNRYRL